jgi:dTDP-4-dehydrorhamnose 3,5-epimerase
MSSPRLPGLVVIRPQVHADARGFFVETYHRDRYRELGIDADFVQDNHSRSTRGTLRGLHYQAVPGQAKLVRVVRGRVWDVAVDLRRSSPTFGQWEAFELDDVAHHQLYIPIGFAHGYVALSDEVDFAYKVGSYYDPGQERGIAWDDPVIGVAWPVSEPLVSDRDRSNPTLNEASDSLPAW